MRETTLGTRISHLELFVRSRELIIIELGCRGRLDSRGLALTGLELSKWSDIMR